MNTRANAAPAYARRASWFPTAAMMCARAVCTASGKGAALAANAASAATHASSTDVGARPKNSRRWPGEKSKTWGRPSWGSPGPQKVAAVVRGGRPGAQGLEQLLGKGLFMQNAGQRHPVRGHGQAHAQVHPQAAPPVLHQARGGGLVSPWPGYPRGIGSRRPRRAPA